MMQDQETGQFVIRFDASELNWLALEQESIKDAQEDLQDSGFKIRADWKQLSNTLPEGASARGIVDGYVITVALGVAEQVIGTLIAHALISAFRDSRPPRSVSLQTEDAEIEFEDAEDEESIVARASSWIKQHVLLGKGITIRSDS